ncbi:hypothetical protein [Nostoc sp. ChiQUE01b]|nr:hypothetical protein [Nostoc sp. ChiQUE01b]MDZ8259861.1 hypothetical protein [Nostoc sp. ChiQUE01b]
MTKEKKDTEPMNLFMEKKKCKATLIQAHFGYAPNDYAQGGAVHRPDLS